MDILGAIKDLPGVVQSGAGVLVFGFVIGFINKKVNAEKIIKKTLWASTWAAKCVNVLLLGHFGKANATKIENGLFNTLKKVMIAHINNFFDTLFADNGKPKK